MQLARIGLKNYALLPWGILLVDPEPVFLAAKAQLLIAANHYVAVSNDQAAESELCTVEVRVAILSQTLGSETLAMQAQQIRLSWPDAFILLFANDTVILEDWLYDDSISARCRPEELLSLLHFLQARPRGRAMKARARIGSVPFGLFGSGWMLLRSVPHESDPTKEPAPETDEKPSGRDVPGDEHSHNSSVKPYAVIPADTFQSGTLTWRPS